MRSLPRDFNKWVNEIALDFSRYIYYKRKTKRLITGYCTSCRRDVEFRITKDTPQSNVRHDEPGQCPSCKKAIRFKATGKTTRLVDQVNAAYVHQTPAGFVIRTFNVKRHYCERYKNPDTTVFELVRDFYEPDKAGVWDVTGYEFTEYKQSRVSRWCNGQNLFSMDVACLYTRNLHEVMEGTPWKYSGICELAQNINKFNIYGFLSKHKSNPKIEYLVKGHLYRLVAEVANGRAYGMHNLVGDAGSVHGLLNIDRLRLKQMQRLNGTNKHLKIIQSTAVAGVLLSDECIEQVVKMDIDSHIFASLCAFTTPHKIIKFATRCKQGWVVPEHGYVGRRDTFHSITEYWRDYLDNCKLLEYDLKDDFILFPRNLKASHDEVMKLYKRKKDEIRDNSIAEMYDTLMTMFGFEYENFIVRPPTSVNEIVAEGHALHHCVGTGLYIDRIIANEGYIFFIRLAEKPEEPFFTAEVTDGRLTQCRGTNNCGMTTEVKRFTEMWKKNKLSTTPKVAAS